MWSQWIPFFFPPAPIPELVVDRSSSMGKANNSCSSGTRTRMMRKKKKKPFASLALCHRVAHTTRIAASQHLCCTWSTQKRRGSNRVGEKKTGIALKTRGDENISLRALMEMLRDYLCSCFSLLFLHALLATLLFHGFLLLYFFLFFFSLFACYSCNSLSYFSHGLLPFLKFANYLYSFNFWKTSCQGVCYVPTNLN